MLEFPGFAAVVGAACAAVVTALVTPVVVRYLALSARLDVPNHRSSHSVPTPRGGGIAVVVGVAVAAMVLFLLGASVPWIVLLGTLTLAGVGYLDDRVGLGAGIRLVAQISAGAIFGALLGGPWGVIAGIVLVPVVVNAFNFMDGINGISVATATVWGASAIVLGSMSGLHQISVLGAVCSGAALGFLPWNAPLAKCFLGDVGSYFFGGVIALGVLLAGFGGGEGVRIDYAWWLVAPLAIYLADTGFTLVRRSLAGARLTEAHREHVYQQLVDRPSFEHWHVAIIVGFFQLACAFCGATLWALPGALLICAAYLSLPSVQRKLRIDR